MQCNLAMDHGPAQTRESGMANFWDPVGRIRNMNRHVTKRIMLASLALTIGLLLMIGSAGAQDPQNPPGKQPPVMPPMTEHTMTISGRVTVAADGAITVVDDQKNEHSVAITADTKVTKAGKPAAGADIKAGDAVMVVANKGEGTALVAVSVSVT